MTTHGSVDQTHSSCCWLPYNLDLNRNATWNTNSNTFTAAATTTTTNTLPVCHVWVLEMPLQYSRDLPDWICVGSQYEYYTFLIRSSQSTSLTYPIQFINCDIKISLSLHLSTTSHKCMWRSNYSAPQPQTDASGQLVALPVILMAETADPMGSFYGKQYWPN